nr:MAG TPA: hypothetical protein [Caudoviricetes sp.]
MFFKSSSLSTLRAACFESSDSWSNLILIPSACRYRPAGGTFKPTAH